ncbi:MAG: glycosyltransferase [Candidatus Aenigmarchaeota archaeon]|nr:glycosyltransferase [Candidatus Aenigmarchaeota archaeon]
MGTNYRHQKIRRGGLMKIIQVSPTFHPDIGGIETHVKEISKRLAKKHEVYVYTTTKFKDYKKEGIIDEIKIRRFKSYAPSNAYFFSPGLYKALKNEECDILHLHNFHAFPAYLAYRAFKNKKLKKLIFTPHYHHIASAKFRGFLHKFYDPIQSAIFKKADKILCATRYEIELLTEKFEIPKNKMKRIPNGIDLKRLKKYSFKKRNDPNEFKILCVSRLEKYKRIQWLITALKEVSEKYPKKEISLTIIGKGSYGDHIRNLIKELGLKDKVIIKYNLPDDKFLQEYQKCDVFVLPSEYEAFSIVTLEALCMGKPVIVSNVGFMRDLSENTGYKISCVEDIVEGLSEIIENGFKLEFNPNEYTWDRIVEEVLKVYEE